jgi:hypothetical protein
VLLNRIKENSMAFYTNTTNEKKIRKEISGSLKQEEAAEEVLQLISDLCPETEITGDPMSQWLGILAAKLPKVQKLKSSSNLIEIYPSGTFGLGASDRLLFQVDPTEVAIIKAYESSH